MTGAEIAFLAMISGQFLGTLLDDTQEQALKLAKEQAATAQESAQISQAGGRQSLLSSLAGQQRTQNIRSLGAPSSLPLTQ